MPLTPFIAATGFLAAILLVWAQSWINIYKPETLPTTVGLGLMWTYLTVIVALLAFALAGLSWLREKRKEIFRVEGWPLGLLVATLIMTGVNVGQSLFSVATKLFKGISPDKPLMELTTFEARFWGIIVVSLVAAFIIVMSLRGTKKRKLWIIEVVILFILGISVCILISGFSDILYPHVILSSS